MLLSEIRYSILNMAKGGGIRSDDSRLNSRLMDYWIQYYRNFLIPEATDFGKLRFSELIQDLGCVKLTDVDMAECEVDDIGDGGRFSNIVDLNWGCTIKKAEIPAMVDLPKERSLVYVGYINKQSPFEVITAEQSSLTPYRMITSKKPRAYRIGTSLYIMSPKNKRLKYVNVRGIFEDPTKVESCSTAGTCACFDADTTQYPFPDILVPKLIQLVMTRELGMAMQMPTDMVNDSVENVTVAKQRRK